MPFISGKKLVIILHIVGWTILFLLPIYLITMDRNMDILFMQRVYFRTIIYITIFYLNLFWLIPHLLFKGKKWNYYLTVAVIVIGLYVVNESVNRLVFKSRDIHFKREQEITSKEIRRPGPPLRFDIYNYLFTSALICGFSIGLRITGKFYENEKRRKDLEKEKISSELAFLKNQVSPHFFFNTLNNIYSLTDKNIEEAQNAILKLSKLMRYLLYDSEKTGTMLSSEISFMKNYVELMKLRLSDKVALQVSFPENFNDIHFPPLLYITFIENAFKHSISYRETSFINICLNVSENTIHFNCKNSVGKKSEVDDEPGIGLENVKKRLILLFPEKHLLNITKKDNTFEVDLVITV